MSAAGDAHMNGDCWSPTCYICAAEAELEETPPRLFVDADGDGNPCVWEHLPAHPGSPRVVLEEFHVSDQDLWNAIVEMVEGGGVK